MTNVLSKCEAKNTALLIFVGLAMLAACFYLIQKLDPELVIAGYSGNMLMGLAVFIFSLVSLKKASKSDQLTEIIKLTETMIYLSAITGGLIFIYFSFQFYLLF